MDYEAAAVLTVSRMAKYEVMMVSVGNPKHQVRMRKI